MSSIHRPNRRTVRLSDEEAKLTELLATHLGTDGSGVVRQGLLKLAREEGVTVPESKPKPKPKNR